MDAMSIDLDVTGHTATTLGSRDSCLEVSPGQLFTLDVTAEGIPTSNPIIAFGTGVAFEATLGLTVDSYSVKLLLASRPGSAVLDTGLVINPDKIFFSAADTGYPSSAESGLGVLARLTFQVGADAPSGPHTLSLRERHAVRIDSLDPHPNTNADPQAEDTNADSDAAPNTHAARRVPGFA
jgi:hypothetical protein